MTALPFEFREEVEKLERKHAENPEGRYFVPLANAYRKAGQIDRAMALLRDGLERHPDYLSAHIVMGRCLAELGSSAAAEKEFRYVLSLDPQNLVALRTLGELASASGKVSEARGWYQDLLAVDPMNEEARRELDALNALPMDHVRQPSQPGLEPSFAESSVEPSFAEPSVEPSLAEPSVEPSFAELSSDQDGEDLVGAPSTDAEDQDQGYHPFVGDIEASDQSGSAYPEGGGAVVTETIAELYTRQGFYDRAAEVYRELIRRRGGDASLEERLRRVERLAAGEDEEVEESTAAAAAANHTDPSESLLEESENLAAGITENQIAEHDPEPEPLAGLVAGYAAYSEVDLSLESESTDRGADALELLDPFADSFGEGFPREPDETEGGGTLDAEGSDLELISTFSAGSEASIRDYLRSIFTWAPASSEPALASSELQTVEEASIPRTDTSADVENGLPLLSEAVPGELEIGESPWQGDEEGYEPEVAGVWERGVGEAELQEEPHDLAAETAPVVEVEPDATGVPWTDRGSETAEAAADTEPESADLFPWEIPLASEAPASHAASPSGDEPDRDSLTGVEGSGLDSLAEALPSSSDQADSSGEDTASTATSPSLSSPGEGEGAAPPPATTDDLTEPAPSADPEDDDLESFQAWLRSLKR